METIVIRRLTGTSKGKEEQLVTQEVTLGTGPHNTVRFDPSWDRGVAASHARVFRDEHGGWWLADAGSSTGTFLNGQRVAQKRQVNGPIVIELGVNGPKVEVVVPPPLARGSGGRLADGAGKHARPNVLAWAAGIVVLTAFAWFIINRNGGGNSDERLRLAAKNYEGGIGVVIIAQEGEGTPMGTAWAVAPSLFATNAHVAIPVFQAMKDGGTAYIAINKNPDQRLRIKRAFVHPDYMANFVGINGKPPATKPYDVGLFLVEGKAPAVLRMASKPKLETLDSGHRIAFLGFPMEDIRSGGVDPQNPVATMQSGIITANTDFWLAKSSYESRRLIQHSLPAVGGASGSPIFDADGDVVGILSSGNMIAAMNIEQWANYRSQIEEVQRMEIEKAVRESQGQPKKVVEKMTEKLKATLAALEQIPLPISAMKRAPSAALINYGQRIDMLQELIESVTQLHDGKQTGL